MDAQDDSEQVLAASGSEYVEGRHSLDYISALRFVHETLRPANYWEIGCRLGISLGLSRCPTVGIDPDFEIRTQLVAPTQLFKMTSDEFFARRDVAGIMHQPIDLAFIDGMHAVEFALRDFMNLEKHAGPYSVIAIDDLLPQHMDYATRERNTQIWTGDVYRVIPILRHYRPDLDIKIYDVEMKGFGLVSRLDPSSRVLADNYAKIESEIAAGQWSFSTVDDIRAHLEPLPTDRLAPDVQDLAAWRRRGSSVGDVMIEEGSLYLDLLKRSVLNEIYLDDELRILYLRACIDGREAFRPPVLHDIRSARRADYEKLAQARKIGRFFDRQIQNSGFNHSMAGRARIDNLHDALDVVRREAIQGDLIECGVWRGGACIFMAGYLRAHGMQDRTIFVADSFEGLPPPALPQDAGLDLSKEKFPELAVSLETVRENFAVYGLDGPNVVFLKGWFKETLPRAPVEQIALLRLDGDLYESTMDTLNALYDKVAPGGIVIVDDYSIDACRKAVADFFDARGLAFPQMFEIDWTGVWFRKWD